MYRTQFIPRDVLSEVDDLFRRVDALFGLDARAAAQRRLAPRFEVTEGEAETTLSADVPGLSADALTVSIEDGALTVRGEVGAAADDGWAPLRTERARVAFERAFRLGRTVDVEGVSAELTDGVLTVRLPKQTPSTVQVPVIEA